MKAKVNAQEEKLLEKAPVTEKEKEKVSIVEETFGDFDESSFDSGSFGNYDEVYYVKPKTKDAAYFEFSQKKNNIFYKDPRTTITALDGEVKKIELDEYTYEKKEIKVVKIHIAKQIKEKNCLFILSSSYTQVGRSIINSLLGFNEELKKILIKLYINKDGFTTVAILLNDKKSNWKYSIKQQSEYIETIKNKKGEFISNDYTELDSKFEFELRNHLGILIPNQQSVKIIDDPKESDDESTFGTNDAEGFFEINENDD